MRPRTPILRCVPGFTVRKEHQNTVYWVQGLGFLESLCEALQAPRFKKASSQNILVAFGRGAGLKGGLVFHSGGFKLNGERIKDSSEVLAGSWGSEALLGSWGSEALVGSWGSEGSGTSDPIHSEQSPVTPHVRPKTRDPKPLYYDSLLWYIYMNLKPY